MKLSMLYSSEYCSSSHRSGRLSRTDFTIGARQRQEWDALEHSVTSIINIGELNMTDFTKESSLIVCQYSRLHCPQIWFNSSNDRVKYENIFILT